MPAHTGSPSVGQLSEPGTIILAAVPTPAGRTSCRFTAPEGLVLPDKGKSLMLLYSTCGVRNQHHAFCNSRSRDVMGALAPDAPVAWSLQKHLPSCSIILSRDVHHADPLKHPVSALWPELTEAAITAAGEIAVAWIVWVFDWFCLNCVANLKICPEDSYQHYSTSHDWPVFAHIWQAVLQ